MNHNAPPKTIDTDIDRAEAARLLRAARSDRDGRDEGDAIDWAFAALPEHRHPRRLKIEWQLRARHLEAADALIAQGLLLRPTDPALMLLRARSLFIQRDFTTAESEVERVIQQRPHHVATRVVAAEIARARRDFLRARKHLEFALGVRPDHQGLRVRLAETLLESDCPERAEQLVNSMTDAPSLLRARVLRAQQRHLDAADLLEASREHDDADGSVTRELIDTLETIGAQERLVEILDQVDAAIPAVVVRAGSAWLALGRYERAIELVSPLREDVPCHREALGITAVAAAMLGRLALAEHTLSRLQQTPAGADPQFMAETWRRALTAHVFLDQARTGRAAAVRGRGLVGSLLHAALEVFDAEPATRTPARRAEIQRHRAVCFAALGLERDATTAAAHATAPVAFREVPRDMVVAPAASTRKAA